MSRWHPPDCAPLLLAGTLSPAKKNFVPSEHPRTSAQTAPPLQPLLRTADCCLLAGWQVRSFTAYVDCAHGHLKNFCKVSGNRRGWVRPECRSLQITAMFIVRLWTLEIFLQSFRQQEGVGQARMSLLSADCCYVCFVRHGDWKKFCKGFCRQQGERGGAGSGAWTYGPAYMTRQFLGSQVGR